MSKLEIVAGSLRLTATLNASPSAAELEAILPLEGRANVWGDEIYFEIPLTLTEAADAQEIVAVGDIAYWPPGRAFCLFFGPTPVSTDDRPRAYSPVNLLGHLDGDATALKQVGSGTSIHLRLIN